MVDSTLNEQERKDIWDVIEKLGHNLSGLKDIVQNPMPLTHQDLSNWSLEVNELRKKLEQLQQAVVMLASAKIV